jgi:hypothetical protein
MARTRNLPQGSTVFILSILFLRNSITGILTEESVYIDVYNSFTQTWIFTSETEIPSRRTL